MAVVLDWVRLVVVALVTLSCHAFEPSAGTAAAGAADAKKKKNHMTVVNPQTRRPIQVHGLTFHKLLQEGFVYHDGSLHRIKPDRYSQPILNSRWTLVQSQPASPPGIWFVNKPSGLLTVPGREQPDSLLTRVQREIDPESKVCHRLDRDTSGVLVLASDSSLHRQISQQFENRQTTKIYTALVAGHIKEDDGIVDLPIGKQKTSEGYNRWVIGGENARSAQTEWHVEQRFALSEAGFAYTRLRVKPHTGRGQQIRLHLAELGHPILGDTLHAPSSIATAAPRLCLHASSLSFTLDQVPYTCSVPRPF